MTLSLIRGAIKNRCDKALLSLGLANSRTSLSVKSFRSSCLHYCYTFPIKINFIRRFFPVKNLQFFHLVLWQPNPSVFQEFDQHSSLGSQGFEATSTCLPSAMSISSTGTILETTPLLPCLPAILSLAEVFS